MTVSSDGPKEFVMPIIRDPGVGDGRAEIGSEQWARRLRAHLGLLVPDIASGPRNVASCLRLLREREGWRLLTDKNGRAFGSLEEFCETPTPWGLGAKLEDIERWTRADGPAGAPLYWTPRERSLAAEYQRDSETIPVIHEAAGLFPMLSEPALADLAADIKANGLREPIVLWEGQIIDGRNRMTACRMADVPPTFTHLMHCPDPVAYVLSANLHRRHLTDDQRALCAAQMKAHYQERAAKRHAEASRDGGKKAGRGRSIGVAPSDATPISGKWTDLAASDWKVSPKGVERADTIESKRNDLPELVSAVKAKTVSLSGAATIAKAVEAGRVSAEEAKEAVASKATAAKLANKIREATPKREPKAPRADATAPAPSAVEATSTRPTKSADSSQRLTSAQTRLSKLIERAMPDEQDRLADRIEALLAELGEP